MTAKKSSTESLLSKPIDLAGLAEYQDGAVVSREILRKKTGTVTVFSFGEGEGLSEHTAPFDAMVYILDGEADIMVNEVVHRVRAGQMIIFPKDAVHSLTAVKRFKMLLVMIRSE
ncbi:MAG TPA: cupin domain-containing protein [Methanocella sp.]|nr:cupin domain-containing protein [Methanocella sp.]